MLPYAGIVRTGSTGHSQAWKVPPRQHVWLYITGCMCCERNNGASVSGMSPIARPASAYRPEAR